MKIERIRIENFRCFEDIEIPSLMTMWLRVMEVITTKSWKLSERCL